MPITERRFSRSLVHYALVGMPIFILALIYHIGILEADALIAALDVMVLGALIATPLLLRKTRSPIAAGAFLAIAVACAVCSFAVLNGGFAFHILMWLVFIPVAVPAGRPRILATVLVACTAIYTFFFILELTGNSPGAVIRHSGSAQTIANAVSLFGVFCLLIVVSRARSQITYDYVAERDQYQRALLRSQKLSTLGQIVEALVHDFNNVLMSMDYARYLLAGAIADDDPRHEEIDELATAMERAKALSRKLAAFGSGDRENSAAVDVDAVLEGIERVGARLVDPRVRLELERGADDASVALDSGSLDQILINLLVNANDAIGGEGTIRVKSERVGMDVHIVVEDTGSGIDPDVVQHIFEPFYTTKSSDEGTGLGLWSVRLTARDAGGDVKIDSEVGVGTRVTVILPLATDFSAVHRSHRQETSAEHDRPLWVAPENPSRLRQALGWFGADIVEPRLRAWSTTIASLAFIALPLWLSFAAWYWLGFGAETTAQMMALAGIASACVPFIVRVTGSLYAGMIGFAAVEIAGLAVVALARGGFALTVLIFALSIPLAASLQKEFRSLVPITIVGCSALFASTLALELFSLAPEPIVAGGSASVLGLEYLSLLVSLGLFAFVSSAGKRIDAGLLSERDQFRRALVRSQKLEAIGTFASSITHDLNNVLMSLEFSVTFLDDAIPAGHPARVDIDELHSASSRIRSLSQQLLCFGRDEDESDAVGVELDAALRDFEPLIRPILGRHIDLRFDLGAHRAVADVRPKRLEQVVLNLLLNARDAMPDGGAVTLRSRSDSNNVMLEVEDSGWGISDADRDRVFDPFFTTAPGDRPGLGLWLCRSVVGECGGDLQLVSTSPSGTTIRVTLPRVSQSQLTGRLRRDR